MKNNAKLTVRMDKLNIQLNAYRLNAASHNILTKSDLLDR